MGSMSRSGGTTIGWEPLIGFGTAGVFFVVVESESKGPSLSLVVVLVTFRAAVFFAGAGGSLGFIAPVFVVRVVVAGAGSVGVVAFERIALAFIAAVEATGFGMRGAMILCTRLHCWASVSITTRRVRRSRSGHALICSRERVSVREVVG